MLCELEILSVAASTLTLASFSASARRDDGGMAAASAGALPWVMKTMRGHRQVRARRTANELESATEPGLSDCHIRSARP